MLRGGIKCPPLAQRGEAFDKRHEWRVVCQHKRIEPNALLTAPFGFFVGLIQNHRMQLPGMPVELVGMPRGSGAPIRDHHDLLIRSALTIEQLPSPLQARLRIRMLAASRDKWKVCHTKFFCVIPKAYNIQDVLGKMDPNELGQGQGDFFGRSKAVLTMSGHALAHVQNECGGVRRTSFGPVDGEVACLKLNGNARLTAGGLGQGLCEIETKRIAKVIRFGLMGEDAGLSRGLLPELPHGRVME